MVWDSALTRELATPLIYTCTQLADSLHQVMSPTLNCRLAGHGTSVQSSSLTRGNAHPEGMGFELKAVGGTLDRVSPELQCLTVFPSPDSEAFVTGS